MDWTEKYRPTTLAEVRGNDKARDALEEWAETWDDHREAVVLHGSPGVGKTSAAHALASDKGWPTIELNASDARTKDVIERVAGEAARSGTLSQGGSGRRLVIMDEADNIHGNADRGGTRAVTSLVKEADQPVILIANDFYEMSKGLRNACREIEFREVSTRSIVPVLRDICRKEDIEFEDDALQQIAEMNSGDLRGAIKDLQALTEGRDSIAAEDVITGKRDTTQGIFEYLDVVIKEGDAETALKSSYDVDETPDDLINWIADNVPKDFEGTELARAYDALARADQWLGRVRATQNYSFWKYAGDNMTAGVAAARGGQKGGWTRYGPPSYWSKLGRTKGTRKTRDYIARQIATRNGTSISTARREIMPFLATMTHHCKNRELTIAMAAAYDLDASHVSFITGSGEDTNKVQSIVEDAQQLRDDETAEASGDAFASRSDTDAAEDVSDDRPDETDGQQSIAADSADQRTESERDGETDNDDQQTEGDADDGQTGLSDFM
ncbi:replication factor C large subunit [Halapricum hydrolyticum]|uniref:Replication factor C large subunit n=1 Tax=Halapricum hydrolyticum TaxID=2979991 RepID=A0AAE3LFP5_9EURY|nr:replication factor C large subunit [Halapricum hydrolyticum]MCU4718768.1 replication factor C large subunit [Halapricum hydrolyticum]MCU4727755.1 replication factor C large subunit [Halapricum hydrolyticum]